MPTRLRLPPAPRRTTLIAGACVIGVHLILMALVWWPPSPPFMSLPKAAPLMVSLDPARPPPDSKSDLPAPRLSAPPTPAVATPPVFESASPLSDSQLAGAMVAGEGGSGGGACDMARRIQDALRRDPLVASAVAQAGRTGQATLLWNGDWVQSGVEEGRGLSVLREAIMWEVGFAPGACREQSMHGLVLLSLSDRQTRFALGTDNWRWSDLLGLKGR